MYVNILTVQKNQNDICSKVYNLDAFITTSHRLRFLSSLTDTVLAQSCDLGTVRPFFLKDQSEWWTLTAFFRSGPASERVLSAGHTHVSFVLNILEHVFVAKYVKQGYISSFYPLTNGLCVQHCLFNFLSVVDFLFA